MCQKRTQILIIIRNEYEAQLINVFFLLVIIIENTRKVGTHKG